MPMTLTLSQIGSERSFDLFLIGDGGFQRLLDGHCCLLIRYNWWELQRVIHHEMHSSLTQAHSDTLVSSPMLHSLTSPAPTHFSPIPLSKQAHRTLSTLEFIPNGLEDSLSELKKTKKRVKWSSEQEIQLRYACVRFLLNHPYYTISWVSRKPDGFYPFLEKHMRGVFGAEGKGEEQIKSKELHWKVKHYQGKKKGLDLLELCLKRLKQWMGLKIKGKPSEEDECRRIRVSGLLEQYKEFEEKIGQKGQYEVQMESLTSMLTGFRNASSDV